MLNAKLYQTSLLGSKPFEPLVSKVSELGLWFEKYHYEGKCNIAGASNFTQLLRINSDIALKETIFETDDSVAPNFKKMFLFLFLKEREPFLKRAIVLHLISKKCFCFFF